MVFSGEEKRADKRLLTNETDDLSSVRENGKGMA